MSDHKAAVAAGVRVDPDGWLDGFDEMFALVAGRFSRREPRLRARAYLLGLLSGVERKNGWSLAELAGDVSPDGMQRLLNASAWSAAYVRDDVRDYVVDNLADAEAVVVVDDTGFVKKGRASAGVQRQYTGTSGKIDNCQLGVFAAYASPRGRALIDRELYLPRSWFDDPGRLAAAGVGDGVGDGVVFATKPQLGLAMVERAVAAAVPLGWVTADEAFGDNPGFRAGLEELRLPYVLAVSSTHRVAVAGTKHRVCDLVEGAVDAADWQRVSCGDGAKGPRYFDWALLGLDDPAYRLLVRRSISDGELAYYLCHVHGQVHGQVHGCGRTGAGLATLVRVAGARWAVEECFQTAKQEVGLDHYQVRKLIAWYRHITLAMAAHAFLAVAAAHADPDPQPPKPPDDGEPPTSTDTAAAADKRGIHQLWTTIPAPEDQQPSHHAT